MADADHPAVTHARIAARQAVMKGLDRDVLAQAFVCEALKLAFGVSDEEAAQLSARWKREAFRTLNADYIAHNSNGEPHPVRLLRAESRDALMGNSALKSGTR
ncbi:MAG: hypothetical protein JO000_23545 [Alphaproteobacteria bacterium]|nr:hypothetical protein [Alphaproteobacteria bacterium]